MRVVADTNVLISGLLWRGLSHCLIELAEAKAITLCATEETIEELREVLARPKFHAGLQERRTTASAVVLTFISLVTLVPAMADVHVVKADPDDDIFIACALAAGANYIVSGDDHLLQLEKYRDIPIVTVREFLAREFPDLL